MEEGVFRKRGWCIIMAVRIYTGKSFIPADRRYIFNVEAFFNLEVKLKDSRLTRDILWIIEGAKILDSDTFCDRLGRGLYRDNLSTGCKILLCMETYPDYVFNGDELGKNGLQYLLELGKGIICFSHRVDSVDSAHNVDPEAYVNDVLYRGEDEISFAVRRGFL